MTENKSRRAIEKKIAIAELIPYVCEEIRRLGEGTETSISEHVRQYYDVEGYSFKHLGVDIGWAWTNDNGVTYVLKDDDQFDVLDLVIKELKHEFRFDFSKYKGMPVGLPYNIPFVIRKVKDHAGSTCIFEYKSAPSYGCVGMDGGYSYCVFSSGDIIKRDYIFGKEKPNKETILATMPELAKTIRTIIKNHIEELKSIPKDLNNGTIDGSHDCFKFGRKRISAWTIQRTNPAKIQEQNPQYYAEYKDNIYYENQVLDIYDEIAVEINKHNIGIQLEIL